MGKEYGPRQDADGAKKSEDGRSVLGIRPGVGAENWKERYFGVWVVTSSLSQGRGTSQVKSASPERKHAGEATTEEREASPDGSKSIHALGGRPRKTFGLCSLLDVPRRHIDGKS